MNDVRSIAAHDVASAWIGVLENVLGRPGQRVTNIVVRIKEPLEEEVEVRRLADNFFATRLKPIETVANTIFPSSWAQRRPEPNELAAYYRERYPLLRRFPGNRHGTYFGRIVSFPNQDGPCDQLTRTVENLRREGRRRGGLSSIYELAIYRAGEINGLRGFPCLSLCSLHMVAGALHLTAHYRNHYLVERAYGNYLGLARLQHYIATAASLEIGELMVVAGHARIDTHSGQVRVGDVRRLVAAAKAHVR